MTDIILLLKYIFLGIVQGITEILPISSSGHLVLFQHILNLQLPGLGFEMFTNMASLIAMIAYFYKDIWALIRDNFLFIFKKDKEKQAAFFYVLKLLIAVIPIGITGLIFKDHMDGLKTLFAVGIALMVTGVFLLYIYKHRDDQESKDEISFMDALTIGLFQAIAILPGVSRSGSTIIGGLFRKVSLKALLKFSFLSYIIVSIPTSFLAIYDMSSSTIEINVLGYLLAFITTLVVTFVTAHLVMKRLKTSHMLYFGSYVLIVGLIALITSFFI